MVQPSVQAEIPFDHRQIEFETVKGDYNNIYNIMQDRDGFLWLAGIESLVKYNGYESEDIYTGETISALLDDSEGLICMVPESGAAFYDKKNAKTTLFVPNPDAPTALSGESMVLFQKSQLLAEAPQGSIWIATVNGLNKYDKNKGTFSRYQSRPGDPTTLLDNNVWSVLASRDGFLWAGTVTGLHKIDPATGRVVERYAVNNNDPHALHGERLQAIGEDGDGVIWVGTIEAGLNRLNPITKTFTHFTVDTKALRAIADNTIYRIAYFPTLPDLLWIGTRNGLSILDKRDHTVTNYIYDAKTSGTGGLGGKTVHNVIMDQSGIIWLVVGEHGFLQKYNPGAHLFQSIVKGSDPEQNFLDVSCPLRQGPDGNIWVTEVTTGIARINPDTGKIIDHMVPDPQKPDGFPPHIEDFDFDPRSDDMVWIVAQGVIVAYNFRTNQTLGRYPSGTNSKIWPVWTNKKNADLLYGTVWGEGLLVFNKKTGQAKILGPDPANPSETISGTLPFPVMTSYYQVNENQLWLVYIGTGFDLIDLDTEKVVQKHMFNTTDFTSRDFACNASLIDSKGRFWMGANRYDPKTDTFTSFEDHYGFSFPASNGTALMEDAQGFLWFSGALDGTLTRIDPQSGKSKVFTERDGICPGLACAAPFITLGNGQVWIAGTGGITFFNPEKIIDNPYQVPVHITRLTQGGKPIRLGMAPERAREITLNGDANFFEFSMAALSYRQPEENHYQYKLEGVDNEWYQAGHQRFGRYAGLNEGMYVLKVKGANNDGLWSPHTATLNISVKPNILTGTQVFTFADISAQRAVTLGNRENNLLFEAAPLDFSILEKKNYAYKLEGYDPDWISIASRRFIAYTNVPPGHYVFRIKNSETHQVLAEPVRIAPPFYRSLWFFVVCATIMFLVVTVIFRSKNRRFKIALETAQLKAANAHMEAELHTARRVQQMLLPPENELLEIDALDIAGFMLPADEVGGDYYDVRRVGDRIKIGIGDVTGHGLESGLVMLMLQTAVHTLLNSGEENPRRFMEVLNRTLFDNMQRMGVDKSVSLSLIDYHQGGMQIGVSGQHEKIIVMRRDKRLELIDTEQLGFPLGIERDMERFVHEHPLELNSGDGMVLYSDGITEAQDQAGNFY